jgi:hypothetical protein
LANKGGDAGEHLFATIDLSVALSRATEKIAAIE